MKTILSALIALGFVGSAAFAQDTASQPAGDANQAKAEKTEVKKEVKKEEKKDKKGHKHSKKTEEKKEETK